MFLDFKEQKIKIGIIGCGRIAKQHLKSIEYLNDDFELKAICDTNEATAQELSAKYNTRCFTNHKDFLKEDLDLVAISTPNGLHASMAIAVAESQKNALVEKPIAMTYEEAERISEIFKNKGKQIFPVMQIRHNTALIEIKKAIEKGAIGKIYSANLTIRWCRPQNYFKDAPWRGTKKMDGGALLNQGIHYVDALYWLIGDVNSVYGKIGTLAHNIETEDIAQALLEFKNGVKGVIDFNILTQPRNLECSITIMGEKGTVKIGGAAVNEIEFWELENYPKPEITSEPIQGFGGSSPNHLFVYKAIRDYFKKNKPFPINMCEAKKSLEIVEAIYTSAKSGNEVFFPLRKKYFSAPSAIVESDDIVNTIG